MKISKISLALTCYILLPLSTIEAFSQFRFSKGYIYNTFNYDRATLEEHGLHEPHLNTTNEYKTIYQDHSKTKNIRFRTDGYGTIEPSSLRANRNRLNHSILFCGGSTTECVAVEEGRRVADVFSKISNTTSVNAGKSGKDLDGCIKSIDFILQNIGRPKRIVIANNVNTLPEFATIKSGQPTANTAPTFTSSPRKTLKKFFKSIIPGTYESLHLAKKKLRGYEPGKGSGLPDLPEYEAILQQGCCHGAAVFNRTKDSPKFDWADSNNTQAYYKFVGKRGQTLKAVLAKHNYPTQNVIIFKEPNSFLNTKTSGLIDFRQFLTDSDGHLLDGHRSAEITRKYDKEYLRALEETGFQVLEISQHELDSDYFYDAVHLSPAGSEFIGEFFAENIK